MLLKYMFDYPCISLLGFYHATTPHILSELWYKVLRGNTLIILTMDVVQRIVLIVSIITANRSQVRRCFAGFGRDSPVTEPFGYEPISSAS